MKVISSCHMSFYEFCLIRFKCSFRAVFTSNSNRWLWGLTIPLLDMNQIAKRVDPPEAAGSQDQLLHGSGQMDRWTDGQMDLLLS